MMSRSGKKLVEDASYGIRLPQKAPEMERLLLKYYVPKGKFLVTQKAIGNYYIFATPDGQNYIIGEYNFNDLFKMKNKRKVTTSDLEATEIFNIENSTYNGLLQFKKVFYGEYYILKSSDGKEIIISIIDIDLLSIIDNM